MGNFSYWMIYLFLEKNNILEHGDSMSGLIYNKQQLKNSTLTLNEIRELCKLKLNDHIIVLSVDDLNELMEHKMKTYKVIINHTDGASGATIKFVQATDIKIVEQYYQHIKKPSTVYIEEIKTEVIDEGRKEKLNHLLQLFNDKIKEVNMLQNDIRDIRSKILDLDYHVPLIFP